MKRLLSVLVAVFMLLTMPITTGIARAVAEGTTDQGESETPSESIALEMEEMDPAKLHVHKLGEVDEEEDDGFDPAELEIIDLNKIVRASIFLDGKSTIDMGYDTQDIANNSSATAYRNKLRRQQEAMQAKIEAEVGHELTVKWNLTLLANAISVEIPYKDVAMIRGMDGVKSVELETQYEAPRDAEADHPNTANTSENMVGAQYAWNTLGYTGAGSKVAIIDTGLDTAHQSVNADAFQHAIDLVTAEGKTVDLMTSIPSGLNGNGTRISAKIPYAYNYVDGNTTVNHESDTQGEHGSHVTGIAAANRFIKNGSNYELAVGYVGAVGMAPDAQILVMKVFGAGGGAYDSDYFAAMTPAFTVEGEDGNILTDSDYTYTYLENERAGTGYIRVTTTNSNYSNPADRWFKIYLPASTSLTVENVKEGVKLTWEPVEGAAGYVIYRRAWSSTTNGWTAFDRWWNVTGTMWTDGTDGHKVYAGTRYQYGVKAFFERRYDPIAEDYIGGNDNDPSGNYNLGLVSPLKTTVRITTRTLNSVTSADGKLTVKWSGSKVFTGYQVQIATDENFTTLVKNELIASASTYSKVYDGLTAGTTYYVRIRSYHVFNGMTYYGEWSNVKNATLN